MTKNASDKLKWFFPPWLEAGTATFLLVPMFYTAGWSYAYHYFEKFNLGLMGIDIPKEYFFQYSLLVVKSRLWSFLFLFTGYLLAYYMVKIGLSKVLERVRGSKVEPLIRLTPSFLIPIVIFSLFWIFYFIGERSAVNAFDWQEEHDFISYQRVKVWADPPKSASFGMAIKREWEKGCYRLLMRNKDNLFLFYPVQSGGKMPTDIIPSGKIEMIRILTGNVSCKEKKP